MSNEREFSWNGVPFGELPRDDLLAAARTLAAAVNAMKQPATQTRPAESGKAADPRAIAKMRGYEGERCRECGNFTLVRSGTCMKCDTCGSTTGCS